MKNFILFLIFLVSFADLAHTASRPGRESYEKAERLFRRLTGVPLRDQKRMELMASLIENGDELKAAAIATDDPYFYQITLKNMAAVMSNRTETPYVGLDDFQATFIGAVRDNLDARTLLTGNYIYRAQRNVVSDDPSRRDNKHYEAIDNSQLEYKSTLVMQEPQWEGMRSHAGLLTTRGWAISHYDGGTNRRPVVFAIQEFLCQPIDTWKTANLPDTFVGRDVDRCNGGKWDSDKKRCVGDANPKVYQDQCKTCHAPMDAMRGAFASMDSVNGSLVELPRGRPAPKYSTGSKTYPDGFTTKDEKWINLLALLLDADQNSTLGFKQGGATSGEGVQSFGEMLAQTSAFKNCMAKRVFTQVCGRPPKAQEQPNLKVLANHFESNNFNLKILFQKAAILPACMGE